MKKFLPSGQLEPRSYHQVLDPAEARCKLARAVLAEIPRQVKTLLRKISCCSLDGYTVFPPTKTGLHY